METRSVNQFALPLVDHALCDGCGECAGGCPTGAVEVVEGKALIARPEVCTYCSECEALCPRGAITCPYEITLG